MDEAARQNPRSPEPAITAARAAMARGDSDAAAAAFRRALDLSPDNTEALAGLLFTPSAKSMFAFAILVLVLLFRPQGLLGKRHA